MNREEWHITVSHDNASAVANWHRWCQRQKIKPLYIELSNFERQLMCAASRDVSQAVADAGWKIIRVKRERETQSGASGDLGALYYECHVKIDGQLEDLGPGVGASRDLYRADRWYATQRSNRPFDPSLFIDVVGRELVRLRPSRSNRIAGYEYEACLLDTNRGLDAGWLVGAANTGGVRQR